MLDFSLTMDRIFCAGADDGGSLRILFNIFYIYLTKAILWKHTLLYWCWLGSIPLNSSITLINPARNSVTSLTPTFKWSVNNLNGPYTLYLHYFSQSLGQYTTDSISTTNTSYTWTTSLIYDNSYSWYVRSGTVLSAIDSFTTIYPDLMFVGTYWVTVGAMTSSPPSNSWDTAYGQCMVIISGSGGLLNLYSDSFATLPVGLPYQGLGSDGQVNEGYMYGDFNHSLVFFNIYSDTITINAFYGLNSVSGSYGNTWKGKKVH